MKFYNFEIHSDKYEDTLNKSLAFTGVDWFIYAERKNQARNKLYKDYTHVKK